MSNVSRIKAAEGYVEVTVENGKLEKGLREAESSCQKFQKKLDGFSMAVGAALTGVFLGVSAAMKKVFGEMVGYGDKLDKMSQRIGVSVESLRQLDVVAQYCGTSLDSMATNISKMSKKIGEALNGSSEASASFSRLGLSVDSLASMGADEAFMTIVESLAKVTNQAKKTAIATKIFEEAGVELFPLINAGAKGVDELRQRLDDLGITMTTQDATNLANLNDSLTTVNQAFSSVTQNILVGLAPSLTKIADLISQAIGVVSRFCREHKTLVTVLGTAVATYGTATASMIAWTIAAGKLSSALSVVGASLKLLAANPWILAITAAASGTMLLMNAFKAVQPEAEKMIHNAEQITATHQQQARADNELMSELEELSSKTNKSAQEMARAEQICSRLNDKYGGLGLTVNKTTGEIEGLTEAQKRMNEAQKKMALADARAEVAEAQHNARVLAQEEILILGDKNAPMGAARDARARLQAGYETLAAKKEYLAALEAGSVEAVPTNVGGMSDAQEKAYSSAYDRKSKIAEQAAKIGKESWELKIEEAEKAYADAMKDAETIKKGDLAYGLSEELVAKNYEDAIQAAKKIRDEAIRQAEADKAEAEARMAAVEETPTEAKKDDSWKEYEREMARLKKAQEADLKESMRAMQERQRQEEEYYKIIGQDINAGFRESYSAKGSFSAWDVMGGGVTTEDKQLKEAERSNKWNEKIYRELQEFNRKEFSATYV